MKTGTESRLKFKRLQRRLSLPAWQATGLLESIWQLTIREAIAGDIGRLSDEDIAAGIEWSGNASELVAVLVECGWLDRHETFRLVVHDWSHHAPNFVRGNLKNRGIVFADLGKKQKSLSTPLSDPLSDPLGDPPSTPLSGSPGPPPPNQAIPNYQTKTNQAGRNSRRREFLSAETADGRPTVSEFVQRWNQYAKKHGLTQIRKLTAERQKKLKARLADSDWWLTFKQAVGMLPLPGDGWQPPLDWLIRNESNVYRVVEGDFEWRGKDEPGLMRLRKRRLKNQTDAADARMVEEQKQAKIDARQTRNAIESILPRTDGNGDETTESSWLFGEEDDSSANGADICTSQNDNDPTD